MSDDAILDDIRERHEAEVLLRGDWDREWLLDKVDRLTKERDEVRAEVERLRAMLPPAAHTGVRNGPGEGSWSVFAEKVVAERDKASAEVERQARHIEELQSKIAAEKSCACSYDAPGDVCAAHSPALAEARAEVERLRADAERFRWLAGQKRLHLYTDGGTWTRDDGTTFRAWGVLAANGVGYPPAETLAELVDIARKDQEDGR